MTIQVLASRARKQKYKQGKAYAAKKRRHGLKACLRACVALSAIFFARIPTSSQDIISGGIWFPKPLHQWIQNQPSSLRGSLKVLKSGADYYLDEGYNSALKALSNEQATKTTVLGDYVLFFRAMSHLKLDQNKEALMELGLLKKRYPDSSLLEDALMGECQAWLKLNKPDAVLEALHNLKADENPELLFYQARALDEAGEKEKAIELYLEIYSRYPESKSSPLAEHHLLLLSPKALRSKSNYGVLLKRAENLIQTNDVSTARALLLVLGKVSAPDSISSEKQSLLLANAEYRLGKASAALRYLRRVTAADPALHARSIYLEGLCCRSLNRETDLLALRDKALKLYPHSIDTEELCYSAATYFDVNYKPSEAAKAYRILYETFPKGRHAKRALWKLALFEYLAKRYAQAAQGFWNCLLEDPRPLPASGAIYWMGRCYEKLGSLGHAKYLFSRSFALANNSYYGQCARKAEAALAKPNDTGINALPGIDFSQVVGVCNSIQFPRISIEAPAGTVSRIIERAHQLAFAGLHDLALSELQRGVRRYPRHEDALYSVMSRIHEDREDYIEVISCLYRTFPDYIGRPPALLPEEVWRLLFPVRHWEIISAAAAKRSLDPALILGLIRQESAFKEDAYSASNARGLMQILPSTGRQLARRAQVGNYSVQKLSQARTNILLGTLHLRTLLEKYGREELALAAYNAGGARVDRWLKEYGKADMVEFIEQIPFSETRDYVKRVLSNRTHYTLGTPSVMPEIHQGTG